MKLSDLREGQTITARTARRDNIEGTAPDWTEAKPRKIAYLRRRETPLPPKLARNARAPNVGDILTLAVENWPCEYSQGDYQGNGEFLAEEYRLEIEELKGDQPTAA